MMLSHHTSHATHAYPPSGCATGDPAGMLAGGDMATALENPPPPPPEDPV